jgi:hypothetical protein
MPPGHVPRRATLGLVRCDRRSIRASILLRNPGGWVNYAGVLVLFLRREAGRYDLPGAEISPVSAERSKTKHPSYLCGMTAQRCAFS